MKKVFLLVSTGLLFGILGCTVNSQKSVSKNAPIVVQALAAPANTSPVIEPAAGKLGTLKMSKTGSATPLR
jgi:hypothetical protein